MNSEKCFFLQYNPINTKNPILPSYSILGRVLDRRHEAKDLGIIISDDLKFHKHIDHICKTTRNEIHRIRRSFVTRNPAFLRGLFTTYVRTHIEYCVNLWNPVHRTDIEKLEKVQNMFTRLLRFSSVMTPHERNECIGITSHEIRRNRGDLIAMYQNIGSDKFFTFKESPNTRTEHSKTIETRRYNTNLKKHSFSMRGVPQWKSLPEEVVSSPNLNIFKSRLDRYLRI